MLVRAGASLKGLREGANVLVRAAHARRLGLASDRQSLFRPPPRCHTFHGTRVTHSDRFSAGRHTITRYNSSAINGTQQVALSARACCRSGREI